MQKHMTIQGMTRRCFTFVCLLAITCTLTGCEGKRESVRVTDAVAPELFPVTGATDAAGTLPAREEAGEAPRPAENREEEAPVKTPGIAVHVCGAVIHEGVYELTAGARVVDAVEAAGGFTGDADPSYVNQAAYLTDGMRLKIPTKEELASLSQGAAVAVLSDELVPGTVAVTGAAGGLVNINTATAAELSTLNGIGEARAEEIIRYRETHGAFSRIEDLMKVTGIKEKLFEKIRDGITI